MKVKDNGLAAILFPPPNNHVSPRQVLFCSDRFEDHVKVPHFLFFHFPLSLFPPLFSFPFSAIFDRVLDLLFLIQFFV